jgi:hypothetical protein
MGIRIERLIRGRKVSETEPEDVDELMSLSTNVGAGAPVKPGMIVKKRS